MPPMSRKIARTTASSFSLFVDSMSSTSGRIVVVATVASFLDRRARSELDHEAAVERVGDAEQRVDPGRAAAGLETGDRRLRRPRQLGELSLRKAARLSLLHHLVGDRGEQPAVLIDVRESLPESLQGAPSTCHQLAVRHSTCAMIAKVLLKNRELRLEDAGAFRSSG